MKLLRGVCVRGFSSSLCSLHTGGCSYMFVSKYPDSVTADTICSFKKSCFSMNNSTNML